MNPHNRRRLDLVKRKLVSTKKALTNAKKGGNQRRIAELEEAITTLFHESLELTIHTPKVVRPGVKI